MSHKNDLNSVKKENDSSHIPYILNGELYQIQKQDGENVTVKCCHCPPDRVYRGSVRSTGNFHMHIKRRHPDLLAKLHEMKVTSILQRRDRFVKRKKPKKESATGMSTRNKIKKEPGHLDENNLSDLIVEAKSKMEILSADPTQIAGTSSTGGDFVPGLKIKSVYQKHQLEQQEQQKRLQQETINAGQSHNHHQQQQQQQALLNEEEEGAEEHKEKQQQQQHQSQSQHNQNNDDSNLLKLNPSGLVGNTHYRNEMKNPINLVLHKMILRNMDNPEDFTMKHRSSLHAQCQGVQSHPIALAPQTPIPLDMVTELPSNHHVHNSTILNLNRFATATESSPPLMNSSPIGYNHRTPRDQNLIKKEFLPTYLNGAIDLSISKTGSASSSGIDGMISGDENPFHFNNHNDHNNSDSMNYCHNRCTDVLNSLHSTLNAICKELNFRNRFEFAKFKYVHPDFNL